MGGVVARCVADVIERGREWNCVKAERCKDFR